MPQPTTYDRQNSFTLLAQQSPSTPYTGANLDAEFNAIKVTLDEVLANLELIQRDDGDLANGIVGTDQLGASVELGVNPPEAWVTATVYAANDTVFETTSLYRCLVAHTSGTFATDLAAAKWVLLADFNTVAIEDGAVTEAKIAAGAVTAAKIGTGAVSAAKIASDAVTTAKILDANVTAAKLATNSVTTDKITDESVTYAKIQNVSATDMLLGRSTAGAGDVEEIACTAAGRALLDDATAAAQRTTLGLGTAAVLDVGTGASQVVQLTAAAKLPAVDGSLLTGIALTGVLKGMQVFTADATYTRTSGCTTAIVIATGGGGAGDNGGSGVDGGGGGGAETRIRFISPGSTETVTIGAGATVDEGNGGNTSFGSHVTANGGVGGSGTSGGAAGSGGTGGTLISGTNGYNGMDGRGGFGGGTYWGGGGTNSNDDAAAFGAGGAGGSTISTFGDGADGVVIVFEFA